MAPSRVISAKNATSHPQHTQVLDSRVSQWYRQAVAVTARLGTKARATLSGGEASRLMAMPVWTQQGPARAALSSRVAPILTPPPLRSRPALALEHWATGSARCAFSLLRYYPVRFHITGRSHFCTRGEYLHQVQARCAGPKGCASPQQTVTVSSGSSCSCRMRGTREANRFRPSC